MTTVIFGRTKNSVPEGNQARFHSRSIHCALLNVRSPGWLRHSAVSSMANHCIAWVTPWPLMLQLLITNGREVGRVLNNKRGWAQTLEIKDISTFLQQRLSERVSGLYLPMFTWKSPQKSFSMMTQRNRGLFLEELSSPCWLGDFTLERAASNFQ